MNLRCLDVVLLALFSLLAARRRRAVASGAMGLARITLADTNCREFGIMRLGQHSRSKP